MNTRLQVEHPVTEMVTSTDLVQWQIRVARGERLTIDPTARCGLTVTRSSAASMRRTLTSACPLGPDPASPASESRRDDGGVSVGYTVPVFYDSMIAKLVAWGGARPDAIDRMSRALREYLVLGIKTTIPFFLWLMRQPDYAAGRYDTTYLDRLLIDRKGESFSELTEADEEVASIATALDAYLRATGRTFGPVAADAATDWKRAARGRDDVRR
jgi:acetyl/propionyl-CoA carboxylase alpha subunit